MRLLAPAKINLHLRVAPIEHTGFHSLQSWMCKVGLFDTLTIEHASSSKNLLECSDPALPCDASNLVLRAADLMQKEAGSKATRLKMHLTKRIPVGGGLGGGSSDAARVLLCLNRLWNLNWPIDRLTRIAATLGSDVPFFLHGPSSLCLGRGEIVHPIARPKPKWVVLILPEFALATAQVYRMFDQMRLGDRAAIESQSSVRQWTDLSAGPLLARLVNDLEPPAFSLCPQLGRMRNSLEKSLGRIVRMSGSGSTLFTLYDDESEAELAVAHIVKQHALRAQTAELAVQFSDDVTV